MALKTDGSVVAWGSNEQGQAAVPVAAQSGVTAIAAGQAHTVASWERAREVRYIAAVLGTLLFLTQLSRGHSLRTKLAHAVIETIGLFGFRAERGRSPVRSA